MFPKGLKILGIGRVLSIGGLRIGGIYNHCPPLPFCDVGIGARSGCRIGIGISCRVLGLRVGPTISLGVGSGRSLVVAIKGVAERTDDLAYAAHELGNAFGTKEEESQEDNEYEFLTAEA